MQESINSRESENLSFERAMAALPAAFTDKPLACGLILGSGWSQALVAKDTIARLSYSQIPGLGASTVAGHSGELLLLERQGERFAAFCGRRHWYEGAGWLPVITPLELLRRLGATRVVLTNAAGGIAATLQPGDFMLVKDHINVTGINPLQGAVRPGWGPRFPDQTQVYNHKLATLIKTAAQRTGIELHEGIYAFTAGPVFETPAEIKAFAGWGAAAVGMSTVPEAVVANAMGMAVAAVSCISNMAAGLTSKSLAHDDVLEKMAAVAPRMEKLLEAILTDIATLAVENRKPQ